MKTSDIIEKNLEERIRMIEIAVKSAKNCLKEKSYLQCAVRLEMVIQHATFDEFTRSIFDSMEIK